MEGTEVPMAEILRLRKQKKRVGGVEFRAAEVVRDESGSLALHENGEEAEVESNKVVRRFAPQTGIGGGGINVDRHM